MPLVFPDAKRGVRELLDPFGATYLTLTVDFEARGLPAFLVYRVGGSRSGVFREDRITVETRAYGTTAADDVAAGVDEFLLSSPHATAYGLLDKITTDSVPTEVPQPAESPNLVVATYRVSTRGLSA